LTTGARVLGCCQVPKPHPETRARGAPSVERESLQKSVEHLLEECRMVLPGVQALFGFQLVAVFNQPFLERLGAREQILHLVALFMTAVAVAMLMAPAAYHRQAEPHAVSERFLAYADTPLTGAMVPLMFGLSIDLYIATLVLHSAALSVGVAALLFGICALLWFGIPRLHWPLPDRS
jgi:hypothetical protein